MNIEQEIRAQIEKNKGLKLAVGEINNHLSILEGLLRNERDDAQKQVEEAYQKGLTDAWEAARKIFGYEIDGGIPIDEIGDVFGYSKDATFYTADIFRHNTVSEAIAKLKAYEEQKTDDEIKVGDEVTAYNELIKKEEHFVVIEVGGYFGKGNVGLFMLYGKDKSSVDFKAGCFSTSAKDATKTGRHFDIEKILEEMQT